MKTIQRNDCGNLQEGGAALVVTLIVCAVLAMVVVALMQNTGLDRASSRSISNQYRAKLAAESGLAVASATLATNSTNDTFIVVLNTNRQLFIGNGVTNPPGSTNFTYLPLFSTISNLSTPASAIVSAAVPATNVSGGVFFTNQLPGSLSITSPAVSWVILTNASGQTTARFAYWVEDLGGRLDLSVVGTNTPGRPTGTNPSEIALWSIFNPSSPSDPANAVATNLTAARSNLLTLASARLVSPNVTTNHLVDLAANLGRDTNEPEMIPFGLGYSDAGMPKYNLNTNISGGGVASIATIINRNLPKFTNRAGAMNADAYVNGIAASIIDYADTDANPTVDSPANPSYLGIENIPWPNEVFDRVQFRDVTSTGKIRIELKDYLEVWNMGNKDTQPTTITIDNNYNMAFDFTNSSVTPAIGFSSNLTNATAYGGGQTFGPREFSIPALKPNEYKVVSSSSANPTRSLEWQSPSTNKDWVIFSPSEKETTNMSFKVFVNGTLIQQTKGGRWPRHLARTTDGLKMMPATPNRFIFCNPIGFATQTQPMSASGKPTNSGGDPRAQLFLSGALRAANYNSTAGGGGYASPGGRNWEQRNTPPSGAFPESEVNPAKFWPDTGHAPTNERGQYPPDYTVNPDSFTTVTSSNNFVMRRNDSGSYSNILELGNIYDPLQWGDSSASVTNTQPGLWTNLTTAATPDARFGGRNTLRIGRWEFSRFATNGTRASQLLDIFAVGPASQPGAVRNRIAGRVNLNTASPNALRALAAGVANSTDAALLPGGTNYFVPTNAVAAFVAGVTNFRTQAPFFSSSQLATITTNNNPSAWPANAVFGNSNLASVTEWNDVAGEEWFAKVYPLATVRSRNFLVHAVGQSLQPGTTNVLSTAKYLFQIYVEPMRNAATGISTNSACRILQSWSL